MQGEDLKGQKLSQSRDWSLLYLTTGKGFLKYINSKEKSKENTLTLVEGGYLTNTDVERAETVFASIFNNIDRPWAAQFFDLEDHMCQYSPSADTEIVRNQLYQLDVHRAMGPDGI